MIIQTIFKNLSTAFIKAGYHSAGLEADWILEKVTGISQLERIKNPEKELDTEALEEINKMVSRRLSGEPLAYIINEKEFYGTRFFVNNNVLIPRPDTEVLVEWAIQFSKKLTNRKIHILDIGTGSGCIGLSLLNHIPNSVLTAVDISPLAIEVAGQNAATLKLLERTTFLLDDFKDAAKNLIFDQKQKFELVLANPPYIEPDDTALEANVFKFEPHVALFSEQNGLSHIKNWIDIIPNLLSVNSGVGFEVGATQAQVVLKMFENKNFSKCILHKDYAGHDRIVCGENLNR
jgi:release factor glutamine methyltransferase